MENFVERCKANCLSAPHKITTAEEMGAWSKQWRYVGMTGDMGGLGLPYVDVWQNKDDGWFSVRMLLGDDIYVAELDLMPRDRDSMFSGEVDWDWDEEERILQATEQNN